MIKIAFFFLLFLFCKAMAGNDESFRFKRCYAQFTRQKIQKNNTLLMQVESGKISGSRACLNLLDQALLENDGRVRTDTSETLQVLRTFQSFHRSWFSSYNLYLLTPDFALTDFFDSNEMGYHLTYSLFNRDYKLSNIVTAAHSFRSIRKTPTAPIYLFDDQLGAPTERSGGRRWARDNNNFFEPELASFGTLVGLKEYSGGRNFINFFREKETYSVDADKSFGAGILGTVPYLLLNSGQNEGPMDGMYKIHRRWAKTLITDLLCREMPVITKEDAEPYVDVKSEVPFRRNSQCMQCHATMDNMAGVIRHLELFNTTALLDRNPLKGIYSYPVEPGADNYRNEPRNGLIVFRDYKDQLIKAPVKSLQELGAWLADQDDFYICTAKKYFTFLTGVKVILNASTIMSEVPEIEENRLLSQFVIEEGIRLKKHQSLRQLIESIVASQTYLKRN